MQRHPYPLTRIEESLDAQLAHGSTAGRALYLVVLLGVVAALAALPWVRVAVAVQAPGILRPSLEKHEVRAQRGGVAERLLARQGDVVVPGAPLLALRDGAEREELALLDALLAEATARVADLVQLAGADSAPAAGALRTERYAGELRALREELHALDARAAWAEREGERARALLVRSLAPAAEAERRALELAQLRSDRGLLLTRRVQAWRGELAAARSELAELRVRRGRAAEQAELRQVLAPVAGTVEELAALSPGSYVQPGDRLAVISPSAGLIAEVYLAPRDVGLVGVGTSVRLQVDAFNYRDWGVAVGRVAEISSDYLLVDQRPAFRARITLDHPELRLRSGARAELRKGLTLQARFAVAERSLFQLLRDDVADWLDPTARPGS